MIDFFKKYGTKRKQQFKIALKNIKKQSICYLFLFPFALLFFTFYLLPIISSIYYSFTHYNLLEKPFFIGMQNYFNLILQDEVFLIAIKNTFLIAVITGPGGYILAFLLAWLINELPKTLRAIAVVIFYIPSIAGGAIFTIFGIIFRGDDYGTLNSVLLRFGFINSPIMWLADPKYMMKALIPVILWMSLGTGFLAFVAGLKGIDQSQYEAGWIDGIKNRWQELWFITLPNMKPMLLFGAVMSITQAFSVSDVPRLLAGYPSTDYAARTIVTHLFDYGFTRFEMGYASAIATVLFLTMILTNKFIQKALNRVGT